MHLFVLIATSDPAMGEVLREQLEKGGYETSLAASADEALATLRFRHGQRRLVVADARAPETYVDIISRMAREPRLVDVPLLLVTSSRSGRAPSLVRHALQKPSDLDALLTAVRECLEDPGP